MVGEIQLKLANISQIEEKIWTLKTISRDFVRYSCISSKFYHPTNKSTFEIRNTHFFEDIEFGEAIRLKKLL